MGDKFKVQVVGSPMGTGKSTYFALMLANERKENITIVCPNIKVAEGTFESLRKAITDMKASSTFAKTVNKITLEDIGKKIGGDIIERKLTVITPGYLTNSRDGHYTIFDEFQTIRHYNKEWIERE